MNWRKEVDDFKKDLKQEPTRISMQALRMGFFGAVGGGKSVTACICAIGVNPKDGLIGYIDGEGQRSGWAIDTASDMAAKKYGGTKEQWATRFSVIHIDPPFNPLRVVAAMEILEDKGCKTIILDILSQAWDSDGGYLDLKAEEVDKMLEKNPNTTEQKVASSAAAHIKPWTHQKLVNKVSSSKTNLILLFQAKKKYNAKTFKPDDFQTPIQESGLTRTAVAVGRVEQDAKGDGGFCSFQLPPDQGCKYTHASILDSLPKNGERFTFEHAESLARLCTGERRAPSSMPVGATTGGAPTVTDLKAELWTLLKLHRGTAKSWNVAETWLRSKVVIGDADSISGATEDQLKEVISKVKQLLNPEPPQ